MKGGACEPFAGELTRRAYRRAQVHHELANRAGTQNLQLGVTVDFSGRQPIMKHPIGLLNAGKPVWPRERRNEGADQGGELKEDARAQTDDPQQGSGYRPENETITADPGDGSQAPRAQSEEPDDTQGQSGQDADGRRSQAMANPPAEPDNPSLANLGGADPDQNRINPVEQEMLNAQRNRAGESARIDAMLMRRLNDNAALVLEARFRAAANARGGRQP